MSKHYFEMTNEELITEWNYWNNKISSATSWGAALGAADEFRKNCAKELAHRNIKEYLDKS